MNVRIILSTCLLCFAGILQSASAQDWSVTVTPEGYDGEYLLLGYYLGNAQYIKDTSHIENGRYVFSGNDTLTPGVYIVIFPPDNQFFQLLIAEGDEDIRVEVNMNDVSHPEHIRGSAESVRFYEYITILQQHRAKVDALHKALDSITDGPHREQTEKELADINTAVRKKQESIINQYPGSLTALIISSTREVEPPVFTGTPEEIQKQNYLFVREHYFDKMPMDDPRLIRTPVLHQRIEYYLNKLTVQSPDSLIRAVDVILGHFDAKSEAFNVYLVYFLNHFAKSNIVGMDAVYVHLADEYYRKGLATWTEEELLQKILTNADKLRPILIGKTAPDLLLRDRQDQPLRLHDVESPFTVLFFWDPECGHCKKSIPLINEFAAKYKDKGVVIFAVCTSLQDEVAECWKAVDEHGMGDWIHATDPFLQSRFKQIYDIRNTPQIFILDRDKKIVMKRIGAEDLGQVMDHLLQNGS